MKRRVVAIFFVVIVFLAIAGIGFQVYKWTQAPELSRIMKPVATLKDFGLWDYVWRTDNELEVLECYYGYPGPPYITAYQLKAPGGSPAVDRELTSRIAQFPAPDSNEMSWRLSPDGTILCGFGFPIHGGFFMDTNRWCFFGSDGETHSFSGNTSVPIFSWLRDSRHIVVMEVGATAALAVVRNLDGHITNEYKPVVFVGPNRFTAEEDFLLGTTADGRCLTLGYEQNVKAGTAHILAFDPQAVRPTTEYHHITFPEHTTYYPISLDSTVLSPNGDRIAWVLNYDEDAFKKWMRRILGHAGGRLLGPPANQSLWISDAFGQNMRLVGVWRMDNRSDTGQMVDQKWLPDEKHLSFRWRGGMDRIEEVAVD